MPVSDLPQSDHGESWDIQESAAVLGLMHSTDQDAGETRAHGQGACSYPGLLFGKAVQWGRSYPDGDVELKQG
jgi:hypothetical protein